EATVRIDAQLLPVLEHVEDGIDAPQVVVERSAADLLLDHGVAAIDVAAHLVPEAGEVLSGIVVAAGGVDEDAPIRPAVAVAFREQLVERLVLDLRDGIPYRHVDRADRDRALAVPARLLVHEHRLPDAVRIEVGAGVVEQRLGIGLEHARNEALAHQLALAIASVGVEAVADDAATVAHDVGDHGDQAQRHPAEVDVRIADGRADGKGLLA